jgi:hypothetical protein
MIRQVVFGAMAFAVLGVSGATAQVVTTVPNDNESTVLGAPPATPVAPAVPATPGAPPAAPPVVSEAEPPPAANDTRFSFHRTEDGYLRLDAKSGSVSLCSKRAVGWTCQALPDDRTALEAEISRLQGQNAALKKDLLARGLPLPGGMKPDAPKSKSGNGGANSQDGVRLPSDAELNKMMAFVEKVWRRLIEMMNNAQRDILGKA